jgi:hypothetical protein
LAGAEQQIAAMKLQDFQRMRKIGERKISDEANLKDMSEVRVQQLEQGAARFELDEKNRRFRKVESGAIGTWEQLEP